MNTLCREWIKLKNASKIAGLHFRGLLSGDFVAGFFQGDCALFELALRPVDRLAGLPELLLLSGDFGGLFLEALRFAGHVAVPGFQVLGGSGDF